MTPNPEWRNVTLTLIAAAVFFLVCIYSVIGMEGMSGGYALAFVSFFLVVGSVVVALLFFTRARVMDAILTDPSPLAHWVYLNDDAQETVEREYQEYRERNRILFFIIGGMMVAVALFFLIFIEDGGFEAGLILLGITVLLFIVSRFAPWLERRRAMSAAHEAVITHKGIVYEGSVYPFRSFLVFWHGVTFREPGETRPAALVFSFDQLSGRFIIQPFDVVVPVPAGEEEFAGQIVQRLGGNASAF